MHPVKNPTRVAPRMKQDGRATTKIVHIIHLDGAGGGPRTTSQHVAYYSNFFDITVIHGGRGYLSSICQKLKIPTIQLPLERLSRLPFGAILLWLQLRKIRPDLLILHGQWAAPLGYWSRRLAGIRQKAWLCLATGRVFTQTGT